MTGNKFQDIILKHSRARTGEGRPETVGATAEEVNTLCGDKVRVYLASGGDLLDVRYEAEGCALCQASASIMSAQVSGRTSSAGRVFVDEFLSAFPKGQVPVGVDVDIEALFDMKRFPAREKCVLLPWQALKQCLE